MSKSPSIHLRLDREQHRWLQETARQHGVTVSHLIREAIGNLEGVLKGTKPGVKRRRIIEEFMFAAMAEMIDEQHPGLRSKLMADAKSYVDSMEDW